MNKFFSIAAGALLASLSSFAGTILLSGDSSIAAVNPLPTGNATFFGNVLGAGTSVLIQELDNGTVFEGGYIANYYNGLAGVTATQTTASSISSLTGVNLLIVMLPPANLTGAELSAMNSLLSAGGTVFLIGENTGYGGGAASVGPINAALAALGSTMSLAGGENSVYPDTATTLSNPLTTGVSNLQYGFTSLVSGGTPLFNTQSSQPFIAVQTAGGSVGTPEPVSSALTAAGLAGLWILTRRRK